MPAWETSRPALRTTSFSRRIPIVARTGAAWLAACAGLALCATTQIEQAAALVAVGCVWADSAAAIHNIRDRQSQAGHRTHVRISWPSNQIPVWGLDSQQIKPVI